MVESSNRPTALVTDDEIYARKLIQFVLNKCGIDTVHAESGDDALKHLQAGLRPALIFLDIMMPGRSGLETLVEIRKLKELESVPIVLLTGVVHEEVIKQAAKLGAKDYIRKPFHPDELTIRIKKLIA